MEVQNDIFDRIEYLKEESVYKANRKIAEQKASELGSEEWQALRILAKTNLFFLAYTVLNYTKLSPNLHGNICQAVSDTKDESFREWLLPRGHYKTTLLTKALSIQEALTDDIGNATWPACLGTDIRICLCHEVHETSQRFLAEITGHFLGNPFLMALFPECIPNPRKHRINKSELELPRKEFWSEPTFDTLGVGGRAQGKHFNSLKLDDLIGDKARDSKTEMQSAIDWFDNIQSLFSSFTKDKFDLIGTRWSFDDLYAHAEAQYGNKLKIYTRKVEEVVTKNVKDEKTGEVVTKKTKELIFPEEFTVEKLSIIRKNKKVWNAQYLNDPSEGQGGFNEEWLRYYFYLDKYRIAYFEGISKERHEIHTNQLNKYILFDPAMTGLWGMVVVGLDYKNKIFILEAIKDDLEPTKQVDLLFKLVQQYQPKCVAIEKVLFSGLYQPWLIREMSVRQVKFKVEALSTKGHDKDGRILGLSHFFSNGQILVNESQLDLLEEYTRFGFTSNVHLLDALAQGPRIPWKPYYGDSAGISQQVSNTDKRDPITGYSSIMTRTK